MNAQQEQVSRKAPTLYRVRRRAAKPAIVAKSCASVELGARSTHAFVARAARTARAWTVLHSGVASRRSAGRAVLSAQLYPPEFLGEDLLHRDRPLVQRLGVLAARDGDDLLL
eukprot:CAMPEP_0184377736 /NCGR_PEP_ID=MMETSP0007-20130409/2518_1 /TAXON_ID=97485 /ORGANISM="Prymnesium parvum, Strain Texoma1" /LENGTH=112 /DNA_ID=CAMNT_0026721753 /DNA_START=72 /DNA_END=408 /DNA_ORIENTATION=+